MVSMGSVGSAVVVEVEGPLRSLLNTGLDSEEGRVSSFRSGTEIPVAAATEWIEDLSFSSMVICSSMFHDLWRRKKRVGGGQEIEPALCL